LQAVQAANDGSLSKKVLGAVADALRLNDARVRRDIVLFVVFDATLRRQDHSRLRRPGVHAARGRGDSGIAQSGCR
jgi:hypothetical protein